MKRRMAFSIALVLGVVLVSLTRSDSAANAAPPQRFRFATGVLTPATGQTLRVTVNAGTGNDPIVVRILWTQYMDIILNGMPAVRRYTVASQGTTPFQTLSDASQALSFDVQGTGDGVNVVVESNRRDVRATAMIINTATGEIAAYCDMTADGGGWTS
jgi:hypothetical protein